MRKETTTQKKPVSTSQMWKNRDNNNNTKEINSNMKGTNKNNTKRSNNSMKGSKKTKNQIDDPFLK